MAVRLALRCFFFFQAEDGIRDVAVTGVQTCALPICSDGPLSEIYSRPAIHRESANPCSRLPRWKPLRQSHGPAKCRRRLPARSPPPRRSEEHTSELQSRLHLVCRLLLEKKKNNTIQLPVTSLTQNT